jgi:hypothetical protein
MSQVGDANIGLASQHGVFPDMGHGSYPPGLSQYDKVIVRPEGPSTPDSQS